MSSSFSSLVDTLSEIYSERCRGCNKEKKLNQYAILYGLKIINYITNVTYVKKDDRHPLVA